MSNKKDYNISEYINKAKKEVKEFILERDEFNIKLKNLILSFQSFDSEIYKLLYEAREFYTNKRRKYNNKLTNLKRKKNEYERLRDSIKNQLQVITKPKLNGNLSISIDYTKRSLEVIEDKIRYLTMKLENQILDIDEENRIIEEIISLESNKKEKVSVLADLEKKQIINLQVSNYYIKKKKKDALEKDLKGIYENLIILTNKRLMTHKKLLEKYREVREFDNIKKKVEIELRNDNGNASQFLILFLKLLNLNKKKLLEEFSIREKSKKQPIKVLKSDIKHIIKKKRNLKKLEQKKLAIALNKQKLGKKLDFYELQLILKYSKE
ncbi:MAG: hypothetical protein ACFE9Z_07130 [Promethearchaeota archaeon]